ncbi:MAG: di-trans,poly-cis-decaprenylcistransferase, partial [Deltaproteobacteria bacterium]|nr:di-trans,poly-cis-decaprenylcistransferase [Deltaproteobacteria bacterium]
MSVIPSHVAIIMDGNGRWAKQKGLPRTAGHKQGVRTVRAITEVASNLGVKVLSLYAFSSENWKRPKSEILMLMNLLRKFLEEDIP